MTSDFDVSFPSEETLQYFSGIRLGPANHSDCFPPLSNEIDAGDAIDVIWQVGTSVNVDPVECAWDRSLEPAIRSRTIHIDPWSEAR